METNAQELERRIEVLEKQMADQLAAAHRAGAIEALLELRTILIQAQDLADREGRQDEGTGLFAARQKLGVLIKRYAEPEEEKLKENPHLTEEYCEKLKKEFGMDREVYRRYFLGEWDVPPEPEEEKKG